MFKRQYYRSPHTLARRAHQTDRSLKAFLLLSPRLALAGVRKRRMFRDAGLLAAFLGGDSLHEKLKRGGERERERDGRRELHSLHARRRLVGWLGPLPSPLSSSLLQLPSSDTWGRGEGANEPNAVMLVV